MTGERHPSTRPPIGFIVEGHGEFVSYPSLASRVLGVKGMNVPRVVADGFGGIVANLPEHLDDLVLSHHPFGVIVTVDLRDVLDVGGARDCAHLREILESVVTSWVESREVAPHLQPLPNSIVIVIQVPVFESWWLGDPEQLAATGVFNIELGTCNWTNVDDEVPNPETWLKERRAIQASLKSPSLAKRIISALEPDQIASRSRSFRKFRKEVLAAYDRWIASCEAA